LDPAVAYPHSNLCFLALSEGRFVEAEAMCQAALRQAPTLVAARNNLALVYAATGRMDAARASFAAAGGEATADYNMGILHLGAGNLSAAASAFKRSIVENPGFTAAKQRAHATLVRIRRESSRP
jgi:Flp pilus assembly protein TadD